MKLKNNNIIIYYLILYVTLLIGFYFGDFARGFEPRLSNPSKFNQRHWCSITYGLLNYDNPIICHTHLYS